MNGSWTAYNIGLFVFRLECPKIAFWNSLFAHWKFSSSVLYSYFKLTFWLFRNLCAVISSFFLRGIVVKNAELCRSSPPPSLFDRHQVFQELPKHSFTSLPSSDDVRLASKGEHITVHHKFLTCLVDLLNCNLSQTLWIVINQLPLNN